MYESYQKLLRKKKLCLNTFCSMHTWKKNVYKYCWQQSNRVQHKHINIHLCSIMFEFTSIIYTWHWLNRSNAIVAMVVFVISCCYFFPVFFVVVSFHLFIQSFVSSFYRCLHWMFRVKIACALLLRLWDWKIRKISIALNCAHSRSLTTTITKSIRNRMILFILQIENDQF